jgi:hypothetical protein
MLADCRLTIADCGRSLPIEECGFIADYSAGRFSNYLEIDNRQSAMDGRNLQSSIVNLQSLERSFPGVLSLSQVNGRFLRSSRCIDDEPWAHGYGCQRVGVAAGFHDRNHDRGCGTR